MDVSFTGIKNIGSIFSSYNFKNSKAPLDLYGIPKDSTRIRTDAFWMNMHLSDDYNGKHLTNFKEAIKKSGLSMEDYKNPIDKNSLNMIVSRDYHEIDGNLSEINEIVLNDKPLELNDNTLPVFSYLGKLVREITHKPDEKFVVNRDYMESDDLANGLVIGENLKLLYKDKYEQEMEIAHNPKVVKTIAGKIDNIINGIMVNYFDK